MPEGNSASYLRHSREGGNLVQLNGIIFDWIPDRAGDDGNGRWDDAGTTLDSLRWPADEPGMTEIKDVATESKEEMPEDDGGARGNRTTKVVSL